MLIPLTSTSAMGSVLRQVSSKIQDVASQVLSIETATVVSDFVSPGQTQVVLDSDVQGFTVSANSILGRLPRNSRVFCLRYPPHGLLVVGMVNRTETYSEFYSATDTGWEKPAGLVAVAVQVQGGGGAGGGANVTGAADASAGGGGGGGACAIVPWLSASLIPDSGTITVGAGGTGVSAGTGNTGGTSNFLGLVTANGGTGGNAMAAGAPPSMDATPGDGSNIGSFAAGVVGFVISGSDGGFPITLGIGAGDVRAGFGGGSNMAGSQRPSNANSTMGLTGQSYGGGGSGSSNGASQAARAGANGADGAIVVTYFFSGG